MMKTTPLTKNTLSFGLALALACGLNAVLVIAKEKSSAVMATMQRATGHHWISHALIVLLFFVMAGWGFSRIKLGGVDRLIALIIGGLLFGVVVICGFYLFAG
jgi:hypothetical protein